MDVSELWMPVSKILDLFLAASVESVIAFALIALFVLPFAVNDAKSG